MGGGQALEMGQGLGSGGQEGTWGGEDAGLFHDCDHVHLSKQQIVG